jgi:hypothetical protein
MNLGMWTLIDRKIAGGFVGFGVLALLGLRLLVRGIRDDIYDWLGERSAPRWSYILAGVLLVLPLVAWIAFLSHQGWFERVLLVAIILYLHYYRVCPPTI